MCWAEEGDGSDHTAEGPGMEPNGGPSEGDRSIENDLCFPVIPPTPSSSSRPTSSFILRSVNQIFQLVSSYITNHLSHI